jgi:4-amino-4-deoxy-L-arabinose transferase-like glycosyltransferase
MTIAVADPSRPFTLGRRHLLLFFVLLTGATLRFVNLLAFPIFNDEAIYARWIQLSVQYLDPFVPLTADGKQPLYYWLVAPVTLFARDPLLALRLTSAAAGVAGIIGVYLAAGRLFDYRTGLIAAWLYAIVPYAVINDRLGLPDGMLAALAPFVLWLSLKYGDVPDWRWAGTTAAVFGLALLVKTTAVLLMLVPFAGLALRGGLKRGWFWGVAAVTAALVPTVLLLFLVPGGWLVVGKSSGFMLSSSDLAGLPYGVWWSNLRSIAEWLTHYIQWPGLLMLGGGLLLSRGPDKKSMLIVAALGAVPLLFLGVTGRFVFSRYAVMAVPFLIIAIAHAVGTIAGSGTRRSMFYIAVLLGLIAVPALKQDVLVMTKPSAVAWTAQDRWQYVEGWPSGYGFDSMVSYLRDRVERQGSAIVVVEPAMGLLNEGLVMRLTQDPVPDLHLLIGDSGSTLNNSDQTPLFYIHDHSRGIYYKEVERENPEWRLTRVFRKPNNVSSFRVYER